MLTIQSLILEYYIPLSVIIVANMNSRLPKIVKALLTNAGSSVLDFIFSPRLDHTIMATTPPLVVMEDIITIPVSPPPKSAKNLDINMKTMAHSLPFTYCISTPVLKPTFGTTSGKLWIFLERPRYNIAKAIKNINNDPMRFIATPTGLSSSKESTAKPQIKCMEIKPMTIPAMSGILLFLPWTTAWTVQVMLFGPGVIKAARSSISKYAKESHGMVVAYYSNV